MSDEATTNEAAEAATENTETVETKAPAEEKKEAAPAEEKKEPTIELKGDSKKIMDLVKGLSAIELNQLVKALEEEFWVSAAAPVMMWGWGWGDDAWAGDDTITVELAEVGQSKIAVIKAVKEILGLGLKEAKDLVGQAPVVVKEKVPSDEAEKIKAQLEEVWATVAFK